MILYSLRTKILLLVGAGMLVAVLGIVYLAHNGMRQVIDRSQMIVYQNQLDQILITLTQYNEELKRTLQEDATVTSFKRKLSGSSG